MTTIPSVLFPMLVEALAAKHAPGASFTIHDGNPAGPATVGVTLTLPDGSDPPAEHVKALAEALRPFADPRVPDGYKVRTASCKGWP